MPPPFNTSFVHPSGISNGHYWEDALRDSSLRYCLLRVCINPKLPTGSVGRMPHATAPLITALCFPSIPSGQYGEAALRDNSFHNCFILLSILDFHRVVLG